MHQLISSRVQPHHTQGGTILPLRGTLTGRLTCRIRLITPSTTHPSLPTIDPGTSQLWLCAAISLLRGLDELRHAQHGATTPPGLRYLYHPTQEGKYGTNPRCLVHIPSFGLSPSFVPDAASEECVSMRIPLIALTLVACISSPNAS
jgi:hypothetical protein